MERRTPRDARPIGSTTGPMPSFFELARDALDAHALAPRMDVERQGARDVDTNR